MKTLLVRLSSNGDYWQAAWVGTDGRRHRRSLGPKSNLSQRDAVIRCYELQVELGLSPRKRNSLQAPTLAEFADAYLASRSNDLAPASITLQQRMILGLIERFGAQLLIDKLTRAQSRDWRDALASRVGEATVCQHVRGAKAMFTRAVDDGLIDANPFSMLCGTAADPDKDWRYITLEEFDRLLNACPCLPWQAMVALCRLAGLRKGEALRLRWSEVDLDAGRLTVDNPAGKRTTKHKRRTVPIVPALSRILLDAYGQAPEAGPDVVVDLPAGNLRRTFTGIVKRAGLQPWADCFQVLRRNCDTDWAVEYPAHVVAEWMGHSPAVAMRYYQQVPAEMFERAAGVTAQPPPAASLRRR